MLIFSSFPCLLLHAPLPPLTPLHRLPMKQAIIIIRIIFPNPPPLSQLVHLLDKVSSCSSTATMEEFLSFAREIHSFCIRQKAVSSFLHWLVQPMSWMCNFHLWTNIFPFWKHSIPLPMKKISRSNVSPNKAIPSLGLGAFPIKSA